MTNKRQSRHRFEQLNRIVDAVLPSLPAGKASHRLVLLVAFRHAGPNGGFLLSKSRIAKAAGIQERQVRNAIVDLEAWKMIVRVPEADKGQIRAYRITYATYAKP